MYMKLYNNNSKTGKEILEVLNEYVGVGNIDNRTETGNDYTLLRWGSHGGVRFKPNTIINGKNAVAKASNKLTSLQQMKRFGVKVPAFATNRAGLSGTVLGRRNSHRGGTDITVNGAGDFFTQYIRSSNEYRVHVFNNKILGVQEKVRDDTITNPPSSASRDVVIRNHSYGYKFSLKSDLSRYGDLMTTAKLAVISLGLDFGAVDIILGNDGVYYVLEVNTAPGLEMTMFNRYIDELLLELVGESEYIGYNHWEEFEFDVGTSTATTAPTPDPVVAEVADTRSAIERLLAAISPAARRRLLADSD